jgi:integrase
MSMRNESNWTERLRALGCRGELPRALTDAVLEKARRRALGVRYVLPDGEVPGLELRVGATGSAVFLLWYRTKAGVRRHHKIGAAGAVTLDEARVRARKLLVKVEDGQDPLAVAKVEAERQRTVRSYLTDVYAPKVLTHRKDGGVPKDKDGKPAGAYARLLAVWAPLLDLPISQLTRDRIEEVLSARKAGGAKGGTMRRNWNQFRRMLHDADEREAIPAELARKLLRRPDALAGCRDGSRVRWLGEKDSEAESAAGTGERQRFETALTAFQSNEPGGGDFLRCAVRLALNTGMRRGEIVRLTDALVKRSPDRIELPGEVTKNGKPRKVFLNAAALDALARWREVRKTLPVQSIGGELFPGEPQHWERRLTAWNRDFHHLCEQAGITDLHFHDLRHDFAVRLLRAGATLAQVRDALGHSSITQTEKYAHVVEGDVQRAVQAM